ncbi:hypothetical protein AGMMS50225_03170 [Betaproteobacteria bacterium]|nr:hypothetical protein AGMMS50225_03170 [Betaproteobacteria bacterium]
MAAGEVELGEEKLRLPRCIKSRHEMVEADFAHRHPPPLREQVVERSKVSVGRSVYIERMDTRAVQAA